MDTLDAGTMRLVTVNFSLGRSHRIRGHTYGWFCVLSQKYFHDPGIHGSFSTKFLRLVAPNYYKTQWCRQQVTVVQLGQISGAKLEQTVITSYFQRWTTEVNQRQALPADPRNSTVE